MDHVFYYDLFDRMMDCCLDESRRDWLDNNWISFDELLNVLTSDYCPSNNIDRHNVIDSNMIIIQVDEIRDNSIQCLYPNDKRLNERTNQVNGIFSRGYRYTGVDTREILLQI